jgi:hypothetical protein
MQVLFLLLFVFLPVPLNISAWWFLKKATGSDVSTPLRRLAAYISIASSSVAFAIPWGILIYNSILFNRGRPVFANEIINPNILIKVSLALVALSVGLSIVSPRHVRFLLFMSALLAGCFWAFVQGGVL